MWGEKNSEAYSNLGFQEVWATQPGPNGKHYFFYLNNFVSENHVKAREITSDALNFEVNTVLYYYCIYFEI